MKHIDRLLEEGFDINIGPHNGCTGYFAEVTKDRLKDLWFSCGHGFTGEEALLNGELIAKGQEPNKRYDSKDFDTMIIKKVVHGAWVQTYEIKGSESELVDEDFEAGDIVEYFDENDKEMSPEKFHSYLKE